MVYVEMVMKFEVFMKGAMDKYPHWVKYRRTRNWWLHPEPGGVGEWAQLSEWCNTICGRGKWEYINEYFMFNKESDKTMFLLRWT
jgi:hypothetical protein